jgi:hypothetical protein
MTEDKMIEDQKYILLLQKDIMSSILEYQVEHGAGSVAWNISISFIMEKRK